MKWWTIPVRVFGRKEIRIGPTGDGRQLRIFMRTAFGKTAVSRVDVQCSMCGEWIGPKQEGTNIVDAQGLTRNQHSQCPTSGRDVLDD